jgi:hypothetical protein
VWATELCTLGSTATRCTYYQQPSNTYTHQPLPSYEVQGHLHHLHHLHRLIEGLSRLEHRVQPIHASGGAILAQVECAVHHHHMQYLVAAEVAPRPGMPMFHVQTLLSCTCAYVHQHGPNTMHACMHACSQSNERDNRSNMTIGHCASAGVGSQNAPNRSDPMHPNPSCRPPGTKRARMHGMIS